MELFKKVGLADKAMSLLIAYQAVRNAGGHWVRGLAMKPDVMLLTNRLLPS